MRLKTYIQTYQLLASNALQETFVNRWSNVLFFIGKIIRFSMFILFLLLLRTKVSSMAGYSIDQIMVFFLTFHLIDITAQILFRGVYQFRPKVRNGEFDFYLLKPVNPLFQSLMGKPDMNDIVFLVPSLGISFYFFSTLTIQVTFSSFILYVVLFLLALLIAAGFHILVLCMGILTTEVDNVIMLYRDMSRLLRFPIEIYHHSVRFVLVFVLPFALMFTVPAQVLLQQEPLISFGFVMVIAFGFFVFSLFVWKQSLKRYSSASS